MTNILLIDDTRTFINETNVTTCRYVYDAIEELELQPEKVWDELWLDFNLKGLESGTDIAYYAAKQAALGAPLNIKKFVIHTSSWAGANMMKNMLEASGYTVERFDPINLKKVFV